MKKHFDPIEAMETGYDLWMTAIEAQQVIAMRLMGFAGAWNTTPSEATRMFTEKPEAFGRAMMAGALATATGKSPAHILKAANAPIRNKTRANAERLRKRGW